MITESKTPESDEAVFETDTRHEVVPVAFARTLETQRDEARAEVERLRKAISEVLPGMKCQQPPKLGAWNWPWAVETLEAALPPDTAIPASSTTPEIFEAHGREWYRHTPGDKMPCDHRKWVQILHRRELTGHPFNPSKMPAQALQWSAAHDPSIDIIGWRPADAPAKLPRKEAPHGI